MLCSGQFAARRSSGARVPPMPLGVMGQEECTPWDFTVLPCDKSPGPFLHETLPLWRAQPIFKNSHSPFWPHCSLFLSLPYYSTCWTTYYPVVEVFFAMYVVRVYLESSVLKENPLLIGWHNCGLRAPSQCHGASVLGMVLTKPAQLLHWRSDPGTAIILQVRQNSQNLGIGPELLMALQPHHMVWDHILKTLISPMLPWGISIQQPLWKCRTSLGPGGEGVDVRTPEIESILDTSQNFLGVHSIVSNELINLKKHVLWILESMKLKLWWSVSPSLYWKSPKESGWDVRWPPAWSPSVASARATIIHLSLLDSQTLLGLFMWPFLGTTVMTVPQKPLTLDIMRLCDIHGIRRHRLSKSLSAQVCWWKTHMSTRRYMKMDKTRERGGAHNTSGPRCHGGIQQGKSPRCPKSPWQSSPLRLEAELHPWVKNALGRSGKHDMGHPKATA